MLLTKGPLVYFHSNLSLAPVRGSVWQKLYFSVVKMPPDGVKTSNLNFGRLVGLVGDFSLNVANPLTAKYFMARFELERLTGSYDLNAAQLETLLRAAPPEWFEVTIHQHRPMFHMEHCVFCAFLSDGTEYRN